MVDSQRWLGFNVLTLFNDAFFMCLMFLLSGLFVAGSGFRAVGIPDCVADARRVAAEAAAYARR